MGHGKNKQKNQKVGLGQQPKETREERRRRIEEEAKAREVSMSAKTGRDHQGQQFIILEHTHRQLSHLLLS